MNDETRKLLEKAARAIAAAEGLLQISQPDFAAGRAYYAMFYAAEALLAEHGLQFSKHAGVHGAFGEHFAKPGVLDAKYHRWLLDAFDQRIAGDYGVETSISADDARATIERAREFVAAAQVHVKG